MAYDVTGKSWQDLVSLSNDEIMKMSEKELRAVVTRLNSVANKRIKRVEEYTYGDWSAAYRSAMESGGKFSVKNKDLNGLRAEYKRVSTFLQRNTSTKSGTKKAIKQTINTFKQKGVEVTAEQLGDVWKIYRKLREAYPVIGTFPSDQVVSAIKKSSSTSIEDIYNDVMDELQKLYEQEEEDYEDFYGTSNNFINDDGEIDIYGDSIPF